MGGTASKQQPNKLQHFVLDRRGAVGEPDQERPVTNRVDMADEQQASSILQPHTTFVVAGLPLIGEWRASQILPPQLGIAQKNVALRSHYLHVPVEQQDMFRMVMVFLVEHQAPIRRKGQQPFRGFNILNLCVVQAAAELPVFQQRCCRDE